MPCNGDIEPRESSIPGVPEHGPLLTARLKWEAENPRPWQLVAAERAIVRGLKDAGLGSQYQVTHQDRFEIAVGDLLIRVEYSPVDAWPGERA
jgi:hypothetical protein